MLESVLSLRFLLLIIGAFFVGAIYLWGSARNKRNARLKYDPKRPRFDPPARRPALRATTSPAHIAGSEADPGHLDEIVVAEEDPVEELPIITREGDDEAITRHSRLHGQLELTFDAEATPLAAGPGGAAQPNSEAIISLHVRPQSGLEFAGPAMVRALNGVGLRFGDMDIFHHYGTGDLRTDSPLFSVANMVEPGQFDLQVIEAFATPGLTMFLRLPAPLDGPVAFELFLNTAQRLAEALGGDLYGDPQKLLDGAMIDKMRRTAAPFANES